MSPLSIHILAPVVIASVFAAATNGQCPDIPIGKDPSGLVAGASLPVKVLDLKGASFTLGQITQIQAGLNAWAQAYGVTFGTPEVIQVEPPSFDGMLLVKVDYDLTETAGWTEKWHRTLGDDVATGGRMSLNPRHLSDQLFFQLVVHEGGHLFFLGDCLTCTGASSAMKKVQSKNTSENANAPTDCDRTASAKYSNNRYPVPGFELTVDPVTREIFSGLAASVTYSAKIVPKNGFKSPVSLAIQGLSGDLKASLSPNPVVAGSTATLSVSENVTGATPPADYPFTLSATWNGIVGTAGLMAKVVDYDFVAIDPTAAPGVLCIPSCEEGPWFDMYIGGVPRGASFTVKFRIVRKNNMTSDIALRAAPTLPGFTYSFDHVAQVGNDDVTMTVNVASTVPGGYFNFTVYAGPNPDRRFRILVS